MTLGRPHLHHRVCGSTNDIAKRLAESGAPDGTLVTAGEQTAGRGRQGRQWMAPPGTALLMSAIARPVTAEHKLAPLAAALAVAETCERLGGISAAIKWPNDVWIDGRKVAGILVEARPDHDPARSWLVVGIGLNTAVPLEAMPEELRATAATLGLDPAADALGPLLERLEHWLAAAAPTIVGAWRERDALRGRQIAWAGGSGTADGVDDDGNLVVRTASGSETLTAGEVHLRVDPS